MSDAAALKQEQQRARKRPEDRWSTAAACARGGESEATGLTQP